MLFRAFFLVTLASISVAQDITDIVKGISDTVKVGFGCGEGTPMCCEWRSTLNDPADDDFDDEKFDWGVEASLENNCILALHGLSNPDEDPEQLLSWFCTLENTKKICCDTIPLFTMPALGINGRVCYPSETLRHGNEPDDD